MFTTANRQLEIASATLSSTVAPKTYQERKEAGICTRPGCPLPAGEECNECPDHQRDTAKRQRRRRIKNRRIWKQKKLCLRCGGKRKQGRQWCATCLVREDRARSVACHKPHYNEPKRVTHEVEGDGYARVRYHGQDRRGRQTIAQLDEQDMNDAIDRIERAKRGLVLALDAELAQMPRVQRQEIKDAALSHVDHAARFLEEVLERNRYRLRGK